MKIGRIDISFKRRCELEKRIGNLKKKRKPSKADIGPVVTDLICVPASAKAMIQTDM